MTSFDFEPIRSGGQEWRAGNRYITLRTRVAGE